MNPTAIDDPPLPIAPPARPLGPETPEIASPLMAGRPSDTRSVNPIPTDRPGETGSVNGIAVSTPVHAHLHDAVGSSIPAAFHTRKLSTQLNNPLNPNNSQTLTAAVITTGFHAANIGLPWPKAHWPFVLFCVLWAIGELVSDANLYAAWLFYIPSPVVALAGLMDTVVRWKKWGWRSARWSLLVSGPAILMVLLVENTLLRLPTADPTTAAVRVIHWNVMYGHMGWRNVLRNLKQESADLIVLSEVPRLGAANEHLTREAFAEGYTFIQEGDFGVLARGDVKLREGMMLANVHAVAWDWEYKGVKLSVLQMDLPSSIFTLRTPFLTALKDETNRRKPDLVVGDFNAPRRSLGLRNLPDGYQHAYLRCGSGWGYTWPFPLPVYSLDHTLVSDALNCPRYELRMTAASDHSMQRFWIEPPATGAGSQP